MKKSNVTAMPRFASVAWKSLPIAALLLAGVTSCSKDSAPEGNEPETPEVVELATSALQITTDPASMPAKVYNYGMPMTSRAAAGFEMPDVPDASVYANLPELQQWQAEGTGFVVSGEKTMGFQNIGQKVYVTGHWTLTGTYGDPSAEIWVLPGATLEFTGNGFEAGAGHITIYNYGTLAYDGGENQCRLGGNLTVYSAAALDRIPNLNLACEFSTNGAIKVKQVHFNNAADVYIGCKIEATESVIFDNESTFHVGYIKSPKVELWATPKVILRNGGYIETDELNIRNVQTAKIYAEENDFALIKAGKILVNNAGGDNLRGTFSNMNILCDKWIYGENVEPTKEGLGLNANVKLGEEEIDVTIEETGDECAPFMALPKEEQGVEPGPQPQPEPKPELETIAYVSNEHTHPISATCIQFAGDKAYVSWHEYGAGNGNAIGEGNGIYGCVEVVENTGEGFKLLAYAEDPATDYNHLIVDGNRLLTVGHNAKSAVVGEIALNGGTFAQGAALKFTTLKGNRVPHKDNPEFYGGDGNCIVRNGSYFSVASYGGLHTLNNDLSRMNRDAGAVPTTGSAKHLSLVNGKMLELNLSAREKGAVSSPAELRLYDASDYTWSNPTVIASNLEITPVDGKNTIAIDNEGAMYVCLGKGGVKKFVGTSLAGEITSGSPANGLAVDEKYLYVAFGKGLYIYDKNDLTKVVCKYTHMGKGKYENKEASCNYVAVNGDLIYLAYGVDGYDVLRMKNR